MGWFILSFGKTTLVSEWIKKAILLVKQGYGCRYWSLPGGAMEPGESIDQAAIREVREETGLEVRLTRVVGLYSKPTEGSLAVCFEGDVVGGSLRPDHEIIECGYFSRDRLPAPVRDHLHQRIDDYFGNHLHVALGTQ